MNEDCALMIDGSYFKQWLCHTITASLLKHNHSSVAELMWTKLVALCWPYYCDVGSGNDTRPGLA